MCRHRGGAVHAAGAQPGACRLAAGRPSSRWASPRGCRHDTGGIRCVGPGTDGAGLTDRPDDQSLLDLGLALVGDAGEVVECLRRLAREGDGQRERLAGELGDVWRYWTRLCVAGGVTPAELLVRSRAKIEGARPWRRLADRG